MKKFAITALACAIALPASAAGVTISGYIDVGYWAAENPKNSITASPRLQAATATNGSWNGNDQFALNEVNLDISSQLTNDISAFASVDFVTGGAGAIDYAYLDIANPGPFDLNVRAGRIPSVIGIEQRVSEANQSKFVNLSLLSPITVGSQDGVAIYGSFSPVNYAVAVTNNDNFGGAQVMGALPNVAGYTPAALRPGNNNGAVGTVADNNNDKAISGRIGVVPIEGLELGVSASRSVYAGVAAAGAVVDKKNPTRNIVAADASYAWGAFSIKGEYAAVKEQPQNLIGVAAFADLNVRGYSIEGWYDWTSKFGLGVRYGRMEVEQNGPVVTATTTGSAYDYSTLSVAAAYKLADNVSARAEYDVNEESVLNYQGTAGREADNDAISFSLVGSF
ncbi:MAG: outer membrane beta-barrel protein [Candidatus Hydrogenedentota bacterium]|mgnify:CR=1 FL=1